MTQFRDFLFKSIEPMLKIQPAEKKKTWIMFVYFFLTIMMLYILKPVRSALFLDEFGAENLRYVYIGEGIFLVMVVAAYADFSKRVGRAVLYNGVLGLFISNLVLFWISAKFKLPYLSAFFYIWQASFSAMITTQFWILANDVFDVQEAKRLFGFVISGGSLGGILGGMLTSQAVRWIKTEDLFLVTAAILVLCLALNKVLWRDLHGEGVFKNTGHAPEPASSDLSQGSHHSIFKIFKDSDYLKMLTAIIIITKIAATIVDNQFSGIVEEHILGKEARTAFFGNFWSGLNAVSLVMQLVLTSLCLRYLGVGYSLWILPAGLAVLCGAAFAWPVLAVGILLKVFDGSVNYSIQQASREVLYLPIASALRRRIKPVVDMLGYRAAKSIGGIYILALAPLLGIPDKKLGLLVLFLLPAWFYLVIKIKAAYSKLLRSHLLNERQFTKATETSQATDVLSFLYDEKAFESIEAFMNHKSSYARKLAAIAGLAYNSGGKDIKLAHRVVNQMVHHEALERILQGKGSGENQDEDLNFARKLLAAGKGNSKFDGISLKEILEQYPDELLLKLDTFISNASEDFGDKRLAAAMLEQIPRQKAMDMVLDRLPGIQDNALRFVMARALRRIRKANSAIKVRRHFLKTEIFREIVLAEKLKFLNYYYERYRKVKGTADYLGVTLKALREECIERIFGLLELLYPQGSMGLICEAVVLTSESTLTHVHGMELLSNTIEPVFFIPLQKLLSSNEPAPQDSFNVEGILKEFTSSQDRWLSLTARYLISELNPEQEGSKILTRSTHEDPK